MLITDLMHFFVMCFTSLYVLRSEINTLKKCIKLVINTNCTEMHGLQNIKFRSYLFTCVILGILQLKLCK